MYASLRNPWYAAHLISFFFIFSPEGAMEVCDSFLRPVGA